VAGSIGQWVRYLQQAQVAAVHSHSLLQVFVSEASAGPGTAAAGHSWGGDL